MENLGKKIEEYSEELFVDLGMAALPEEKQAEIYARLRDHLNKVILDILTPAVTLREIGKIRTALDQEINHELKKILKKYRNLAGVLKNKIEEEFHNLKLKLREEQNRGREQTSS